MVKIFKFRIAGDPQNISTEEIENKINQSCKNIQSISVNTYTSQTFSNGFQAVYAIYTVLCKD